MGDESLLQLPAPTASSPNISSTAIYSETPKTLLTTLLPLSADQDLRLTYPTETPLARTVSGSRVNRNAYHVSKLREFFVEVSYDR